MSEEFAFIKSFDFDTTYVNSICCDKEGNYIILSDKKSVDNFMRIYEKYKGKIKYFVLLPLSAQGRAKKAKINWKYIVKTLPEKCPDIAFGANFYPYLCETPGRFPVSLYSPEIMSAYLDLETMKVFKSSFSDIERKNLSRPDLT